MWHLRTFSWNILNFFAVLRAVDAIDTREYTFTMLTSSTMGPTRLAPSFTAPTDIFCLQSCLSTYASTCRSVMFHDATNLCTHGTWLSSSEPPPSPEEGQLYVLSSRYYCNSTNGFRVVKSGSTYACVGRFPPQGGYNQSDYFCRDKGGVLMSAKTLDKLAILRSVSGPGNVFIGLDDRQMEGTFVWKDGNEVLTQEQRSFLFASGEPNGVFDTAQDCVVIYNAGLCYDAGCDNFPFVCEL